MCVHTCVQLCSSAEVREQSRYLTFPSTLCVARSRLPLFCPPYKLVCKASGMILSLLSCVEETESQTVLPCTRFLYRFRGSEPGSSCWHDNAVSTEPLSQYKFLFLKRTQLGECLLHMLEALSSILSTT